MKTPKRILLIHFGQLGDAVMALPAVRALRARFPRAHLTILTAPGPAAIYRLAGLDQRDTELWIVDRMAWKLHPWRVLFAAPRLLLRLRWRRFNLSVDLHSFKETNWLAFLAGIPERVAMLRPTRSIPSLINRRPPPDDPYGRLLDRYCQVLQPLGIQLAAADRIPTLTPPPPPAAFAGSDRPILGLCPGAGFSDRRWPADRFAAVAQAWLARGARVVVFAGPEEDAAVLDPLAAVAGVEIIRGLSIPELAAALARCRVLLSNPTGPSHIAAAVGARVLTLGEFPAFDPVPVPPGQLRALRRWPQSPSCSSGSGHDRRASSAKLGTPDPCRGSTLGKGREASGARTQGARARERTGAYVTEPERLRTKRRAAYRPAPLQAGAMDTIPTAAVLAALEELWQL